MQDQYTHRLQKPHRMVDEELLATVRTLPCMACRPGSQRYRTEPDHVTSRGAGGNDTPENLLPLCTEHHRLRHTVGICELVRRFPAVRTWMELAKRHDILSRCNENRTGPPRP